ncbi:hypothetical protein OIU84_003544 [Salix udensis]|uniref:Uncharacterized protein n=1 Tax=Salix udensis TaxID=889485 RepID=A0AAD6P3E4_9ROSI|nr:hypothetical protein OIU84_003544 [Salix udensis]
METDHISRIALIVTINSITICEDAIRGRRDFVWAEDIWPLYPGGSIMSSFFGKGWNDWFTTEEKAVNWKSESWSIRQIFADCKVAFGDGESPFESKQSQLARTNAKSRISENKARLSPALMTGAPDLSPNGDILPKGHLQQELLLLDRPWLEEIKRVSKS